MSEAERQNIAAKRWTCKHWHSGQHANASEPCGYCALEAENEALRKDAERYREVRRRKSVKPGDCWITVYQKHSYSEIPSTVIVVDAVADAAIDAAMQGAKE